MPIKRTFTLRSLALLIVASAVVCVALLPTNNANRFCNSFHRELDNNHLAWLDHELQAQILNETDRLQLAPDTCCFYEAHLEPATISDLVRFRRRIRIEHGGNWAIRQPRKGDTADRTEDDVFDDLLYDRLNVLIGVTPYGFKVI
ncbi:hypothetical protein [Rhodopirellula bahusiensis]|uniref:Uncharacterized protein n=1 Tax=Rhodopirellula bahusiensis TaxID=2014065 RepID=A0A2G1W1A1_9BACT|nr:hypothetical protein [Rhodopirellula bahusiensis]PHQ32765.1 hypothetical protein CEE69_23530 [Rhodopirellula bahusiensis]